MLARLAVIVVFNLIAVPAGFAGEATPYDDGTGRPRSYLSPDPSLAALGERLFFETRISRSGRMSCATCHSPDFAFAEPRRTSIHDDGKVGPRNAPSVLTAAFLPRLMWDGRFGSLEEQVHGPVSARGEMGISIQEAALRLAADPMYEQLFTRSFGEPPSAAGIASAIAAFERSLVSSWSPFDRFSIKGERGALNEFERFGLALFAGKGHCAACHTLPGPRAKGYALFSDFRYHNLGIGFYRGRFKDAGLGAISRRIEDTGAFRTPSLRNVAVTAPYMHDGSLSTLHDVVEFYNHGGQRNPFQSPLLRPLGLSEEEKQALVAFLNTLTTEDFSHPRGFDGQPQASFDPRH